MKRILLFLFASFGLNMFLIYCFSLSVNGANADTHKLLQTPHVGSYNVYKSNDYRMPSLNEPDEKILFILDYSASMTEHLGKHRKVDLMLDTMSKILPAINKDTHIGLRVYGHKIGFTQYDACKASSLLLSPMPGAAEAIQEKLQKNRAKGMTPITYSLKKAVEDDFAGYNGKKHIILLTDGGENCDESPCVWAMELIKTRKDVKIDVIAFNVDDQDDIDQLECTALVTSGKFHRAKTSAELVDGFRKSLNIRKEVGAKIIPNP